MNRVRNIENASAWRKAVIPLCTHFMGVVVGVVWILSWFIMLAFGLLDLSWFMPRAGILECPATLPSVNLLSAIELWFLCFRSGQACCCLFPIAGVCVMALSIRKTVSTIHRLRGSRARPGPATAVLQTQGRRAGTSCRTTIRRPRSAQKEPLKTSAHSVLGVVVNIGRTVKEER